MFLTRSRFTMRSGLTLLELVTVTAILAILAGALVPLVTRYAASSRDTAARASLVVVRDAIMGVADRPGFLADTGRLPNSITELLNNPFPSTDSLSKFDRDIQRGWRGPYLLNATAAYPVNDSYGAAGDGALVDPWGKPIILQRLQITGGNLYFTDRTGTTQLVGGTSLSDGDYSRLISGGPNGAVNSQPNDPAGSARGDDIVLYLSHADTYH